MEQPRFQTLEALRDFTEAHPPNRADEYAQLEKWEAETKRFLRHKKPKGQPVPNTTATPQEIIEKSREIRVFAPRTIHESYRLFLRFFEGPLPEEKILQGAFMIYGWMPTMLRIKGPKTPILKLVEASKKGQVTEELLAACAQVLNNSLVGTTKLIHFINPELYPIWDSRVYRSLHRETPHPSRLEKPAAYTHYQAWINELRRHPEFPALKRRFETEAGYPVSDKRAAEATLYSLGEKPKKPKKS